MSGAWRWMRLGFCAAQAVEIVRQARQVVDAGRHPGVNFGAGLLHGADGLWAPAWVPWIPWAIAAAGLGVLATGGRGARLGLSAWMAAELSLFALGGWEVNAPERVASWAAASLWLALPGEALRRGRSAPPPQGEDPWPRRFLLAWMAGMYGMSGVMKLHEPGWWDGTILAQALLDPWMGGTAAGAWLAARPVACAWLGRGTIAFEILAAVGLWLPRWNPWTLAAGLLFHAGVGTVMSVGTLGWTVLACYPPALSPAAWERLRAASGRIVARVVRRDS